MHPEQSRLYVYDGSILSNVAATSGLYYSGRMAVCNDKLYFNTWYNHSNICLAVYDGEKVTLLGKENSQYYRGGLFEFGGKLYFNAAGKLICYDPN